MSTTVLIGLLVASVALLLFLVIKLKLHAFISLLIVSLFMGILAGMPLNDIISAMTAGMGGTLGFLATVIGLGAMFGKMLEVTGGAERLAQGFLNKFGEKRANWAMLLAGFLVSIPVFFDVGFIILVPLVFALAKKSKKSVLVYGIPLLAGLAVTHAFVPPTPGPILVAGFVGADIGKVILYGIICGLPAAVIAGPVFGNYIGKKIHTTVPDYLENTELKEYKGGMPSFGTVFGLILFPIVLILLNTAANAWIPEGNLARDLLGFIGHPIVALILATLAAFIVLGRFKGMTMDDIMQVSNAALNSTGLIILVTGAGGVFKQVLVNSGIGDAIGESFAALPLSPLLLAFLLAVVVRLAAGSATVAMTTAAAIVAPIAQASTVEPALIVIAIAAGATAFSHVNDSGFWLVNRYFGLSEKDTLRSWTVMETLIGFVGLGMAMLLSLVV
ncbi:MAG: gluconate:H+ symporter [Eubacteriales bacterium]|nr:gluconate:H+ symporter [Eubacteriales bacterium]